MATRRRLAFLQLSTPDNGAEALYQRINRQLKAKKRVLWLVSGGSNVAISVSVMKRFADANLTYLAIALSDERYGPYDHPESNMHRLLQAGFKPRGASMISMLAAGQPLPLKQATSHYARILEYMLSKAQLTVAQLGIGEDGHIAGILPGSLAVKSPDSVVCYESSPFSRISIGFSTLKRVDAAYVFAFGKSKGSTLQSLRDQHLSLNTQPAQILKQLPEVYVYSDQIGDKV
jgi:6-phosphogluconolactonase/glucosamine-6-phosphate isomerase/deaminase